ncbi:MAG TPA: metal-dependent hydrolase [Candidatus Acidoferrales bacterium]|nr:metal-dependent hydrolase [Candidatus Acidoferrales bacterium]
MLNLRGNKITWLGHSAFRITTASGKAILIDPFLSGNPLCPENEKKQPRVDAILLTHGHGDHLGDTLELARQHKPAIVCIYELSLWLGSKGAANLVGMSKGGTTKVADADVTMTHAFHSSSVSDGGKLVYVGEPAGFIVRLPGGLSVYHAGDTGVFGDMKLIAELYQPEVACLPIGDFYTMGPREAAMAIRLLSVKHVLPMHYATFPPLTGRPSHVRELTKDIAGLEINELKPGETLA